MSQTFKAGGAIAEDEPQLAPPTLVEEPTLPDPQPTLDPEPEVVDPAEGDGEKLDLEEAAQEMGAAVAIIESERFDVAVVEPDWGHDYLEFKGDKLAVRLPKRKALAAFSLATSRYTPQSVKTDLTNLFIVMHLSSESYGRVMSRLINPDEKDYDVATVGELFNDIVMASIEVDKAEKAAKVESAAK